MDFKIDPRFTDIEPFEKKIWLSSPTMHGDEQKWFDETIRTNWVSTVGENINEIDIDNEISIDNGKNENSISGRKMGKMVFTFLPFYLFTFHSICRG